MSSDGSALGKVLVHRTVLGLFGYALILACAPKVPDTSASEHAAAAIREDEQARVHEQARKEAAESAPPCTDGVVAIPCWTIGGPVEKHERAVRLHERLAQQHRASAQALRDAEAESCVGLAPSDRDVSPFFHSSDIAAVEVSPRAVVVTFRPVRGLTEDGLRRTVECHLARNASLGHDVPHMGYCLLVPAEINASVAATAQGLVVRVSARSEDAAAELHRRAGVLRERVGAAHDADL